MVGTTKVEKKWSVRTYRYQDPKVGSIIENLDPRSQVVDFWSKKLMNARLQVIDETPSHIGVKCIFGARKGKVTWISKDRFRKTYGHRNGYAILNYVDDYDYVEMA